MKIVKLSAKILWRQIIFRTWLQVNDCAEQSDKLNRHMY